MSPYRVRVKYGEFGQTLRRSQSGILFFPWIKCRNFTWIKVLKHRIIVPFKNMNSNSVCRLMNNIEEFYVGYPCRPTQRKHRFRVILGKGGSDWFNKCSFTWDVMAAPPLAERMIRNLFLKFSSSPMSKKTGELALRFFHLTVRFCIHYIWAKMSWVNFHLLFVINISIKHFSHLQPDLPRHWRSLQFCL